MESNAWYKHWPDNSLYDRDMKVATLQKQYITRVNLCIAAECKQAFKMYSVILYANLFNFNLFLNTSWLCIAAVLICIWMLFVWKPFKLQIKELHVKCIFWFQKMIFRYMYHEFEFLLLKILSCFDVKKKSILWYQKFKLILFLYHKIYFLISENWKRMTILIRFNVVVFFEESLHN